MHKFDSTERIIGRWIDGKAIYEIAVPLPFNGWSALNIDKLLFADAISADKSRTLDSNAQYMYYANNTINIGGGGSWGYAIIQYTKTTDTGGV